MVQLWGQQLQDAPRHLASYLQKRKAGILMGDFSEFFKESDATLGIFYPRHYVIATFPKYSAAKEAYQSVRNAGFPEGEAMLATGAEALAFFKHFREDAGLWGIVMRPISRFFATEVIYADRDIDHAQEGSGFVAVHSRTEQTTRRITELMNPFAPSSMEWYLAGGIRSLI